MSVNSGEPGEGELLAVGKILGPHGVRGAVVVEAISDFPGRFREGSRLLLGTPGALDEVVVKSSSSHKGHLLVYLDGVDDRSSAERLRGCYLWIGERQAATLGEGEYWIHELIGMRVVSDDGCELGCVREVVDRTAQDILSVADSDGREFQIPFVGEFVRHVDTGERTITVRLIEGMVPGD